MAAAPADRATYHPETSAGCQKTEMHLPRYGDAPGRRLPPAGMITAVRNLPRRVSIGTTSCDLRMSHERCRRFPRGMAVDAPTGTAREQRRSCEKMFHAGCFSP